MRIVHSGCTRAVTESLNTTMRAIGRILCARSVSSSAGRLRTAPAVPALRANSGFGGLKFSPNSSFMSITSALISVSSAIWMSCRMRFVLCAANRFT